jgi:hypothetical protein
VSIFSDCIGVGLGAIEGCAGEVVQYHSPGRAPIEVTDAVADSVNGSEQVVAQTAVRSTSRMQWWVIRASKLEVEPLQGTLITRADGRRYQVQNPNRGPIWEWAEGQGTHYRICSVEVQRAG